MEIADLESVLTLGQREELESKGLWEDWLVKTAGVLQLAHGLGLEGNEPFFEALYHRLYDGSLEHGLGWQDLDNLHEALEETLDGANYAVFEFLHRGSKLPVEEAKALSTAIDSMRRAWSYLLKYEEMASR